MKKGISLEAIRLLAGVAIFGVAGCAPPSYLGEYVSAVTTDTSRSQSLPTPLRAGLILVIPEAEAAKETALPSDLREKWLTRLQQQFNALPDVQVLRLFPPLVVSSNMPVTPERLREVAKGSGLEKLFVVVTTSRVAPRVLPYPRIETQLFVTLDLALLELAPGRIVFAESAQADYSLLDRYDGVKDIRYPRIFYRDITTSGPFEVVDGNPQVALGDAAFREAADQLSLKVRERLKEAP
jgi:hypothetical protein